MCTPRDVRVSAKRINTPSVWVFALEMLLQFENIVVAICHPSAPPPHHQVRPCATAHALGAPNSSR